MCFPTMLGVWTREILAGKAVDVYDPAGGTPRFALVYLHPFGLETLVDRPAFTRWLDDFHLGCVGPNAMHSWWADRVCREFDEKLTAERFVVEHVAPFAQARWNLAARRLGIFGISMGGQGALRLAFRYPDLFPATAGISSAIEYYELYGQGHTIDEMYDSKEQCRQDSALMHIVPHRYPPHIFFAIDPEDTDWYRDNDRLHEKLNALGIEHRADLTTSAGGHSWDYFTHMAEPALRFLHDGLEKESRRLL